MGQGIARRHPDSQGGRGSAGGPVRAGLFRTGDVKCTYGTGSFIVMNTGRQIVHSGAGLLTTVAWQLGEQAEPVYALEGGAFVCGAAVQWLRDGLGIITTAREVETLARRVADHGGVEFVPALTGLGAPHWAPEARGTLSGLTRGRPRPSPGRRWTPWRCKMPTSCAPWNRTSATHAAPAGGRRRGANNLLMQIQADILGRKLIRPKVIETTVAGACYLAGLGVGLWSTRAELRQVWRAGASFLRDECEREAPSAWLPGMRRCDAPGGARCSMRRSGVR